MQHKLKIIAGILVFALLALISLLFLQPATISKNSLAFSVEINENTRKVFLEVWQEYNSLHGYGFDVVQSKLSSSTMQAQPVIDLSELFGNSRRYRLDVAEKVMDSGDLYLTDLPENVLELM